MLQKVPIPFPSTSDRQHGDAFSALCGPYGAKLSQKQIAGGVQESVLSWSNARSKRRRAHAPTPQLTDNITCHMRQRGLVAELLTVAGITTALEQKLPDGQEQPADLRILVAGANCGG